MLSLKKNLVLFSLLAVAALGGALWLRQEHIIRSEAFDLYALEQIAGRLADKDPETAMALGSTLRPGKSRDGFILKIAASQWATTDPQAALAWVQQLPEGNAKQATLREIGQQRLSLKVISAHARGAFCSHIGVSGPAPMSFYGRKAPQWR
jgi:hypothetical protein